MPGQARGKITAAIAASLALQALCASGGDGSSGAFTLRLSGVLGQSQPQCAPPLPWIGADAAFVDGSGALRVAAGDRLYKASREKSSGGWKAEEELSLPSPARWAQHDGKSAYILCQDRSLLKLEGLDTAIPSCEKLCQLKLQPSGFAVVPACAEGKGFGAKGKIFILKDAELQAFSDDGAERGVAFKLPSPGKAKWNSVGIDAKTGDLLAGCGYPETKIRRFVADGQELKNSTWPLKAQCDFIQSSPVGALAGHGLFGFIKPPAREAPPKILGGSAPEHLWSFHARGAAALPDGSLCVASSQGAVFFEESGAAIDSRIGGLPRIEHMAAAPDGTLLASCEKGQRILRLAIDGRPDSRLLCDDHEPWRVGNGWKGAAAGLAWDGTQFLVLDGAQSKLWSFEPRHTGWAEEPWKPLGKEKAWQSPKAFAAGDAFIWVLDGDKILESRFPSYGEQTCLQAPQLADGSAPNLLAADKDRALFVASDKSLAAMAIHEDGKASLKWTCPAAGERISSLSASEGRLAVVDEASRRVMAFDANSGELLASAGPDDAPGGFAPLCVATLGPWIFVYDDLGKRILRFKLERTGSEP